MERERVLIVDDSREIRQALVDLVLAPKGYRILSAVDGLEGLRMIVEEKPDLVILDERLPGMTGLEILKALKEQDVRVPVIFITSHGSEDLVVQVFRLGVRDYVIKPFDPREMRRVVERVLGETRLRAERDALTQQLHRLNERLERQVQELRTLYSIGRSVTSLLDVNTILTRVVEAAVFVTRADEGLLLLVEEGTDDMVLCAAKNVDENVGRELRVRVQDSLAGTVLETGKPVVVSGQRSKVATGYLVNALVYVPVCTPERGTIGVLGVTNRRSDQSFTAHEAQLLAALADYAAVALENARLYEQADAEGRKLQAVLQETEEAVIVLDGERRILLCNPAACSALDITLDAVGRGADTVVSQAPLQELFRSALESKRTMHTEVATVDGRTFNAQLSPVEGVGSVLMMQDITHLKELDRLKNEFIQNVSHELRSPLALVRGYAEMLDTGELGDLRPEQEVPVAVIARRARMLSDLVRGITLILEAESNPPDPEPTALDELARAAVEDFQISVRQAGLKLHAEIAPDLPPVGGSPIHLRRVLDNLLDNAVKFTPEGGSILVRVLPDGDQVVLEVSDTGIGIPPDQQGRIFERFYQVDGSAKRRYGGVGLGLALVKEIVEVYGGRVALESAVGKGSTFTVSLPMLGP